jgi:hypothetical protein
MKTTKTSKTGRKRLRRGRPPAPLGLITSHVLYLGARDPSRKKESIIADVGRHRQVTRSTVHKALAEHRQDQDRLASIAKEALPRLQASQHALAEAKAALRAEKRRHSALCEQLRAEYGPDVLKISDKLRKLMNKKGRAKEWAEVRRTIAILKYMGNPLGAELEESFKMQELTLSTVRTGPIQ